MKKIPKRKPGKKGIAKKTLQKAVGICVVIDSREKNAWDFEKNLPSGLYIKKTFIDKLDAGDYTIVGFDLPDDDYSVIVERKASLEEFLGNIGRNWDVFKKELEKLKEYKNKVILIEDDLNNIYARFNAKKGIYGRAFNIHPNFVLKRVSEIYTEYNIPVMFVSNKSNAQRIACNIFRDSLLRERALDEE